MESVMCAQILQTSMNMMMVSMAATLGGQAVFPISNTARCFWRTWPVRSAYLAISDYFLWGYVKCKLYETRSANSDDLKQRSECIQGILKEILQYVTTSLPSRGANQCHIQTLTIHGHEMCLQKLIIFFPVWDKMFHFKNRQVFLIHPVLSKTALNAWKISIP